MAKKEQGAVAARRQMTAILRQRNEVQQMILKEEIQKLKARIQLMGGGDEDTPLMMTWDD